MPENAVEQEEQEKSCGDSSADKGDLASVFDKNHNESAYYEKHACYDGGINRSLAARFFSFLERADNKNDYCKHCDERICEDACRRIPRFTYVLAEHCGHKQQKRKHTCFDTEPAAGVRRNAEKLGFNGAYEQHD